MHIYIEGNRLFLEQRVAFVIFVLSAVNRNHLFLPFVKRKNPLYKYTYYLYNILKKITIDISIQKTGGILSNVLRIIRLKYAYT